MRKPSGRILRDDLYDIPVETIDNEQLREFALGYYAKRIRYVTSARGYDFYGVPRHCDRTESLVAVSDEETIIDIEEPDRFSSLIIKANLNPYYGLILHYGINRAMLPAEHYNLDVATIRDQYGGKIADELKKRVGDDLPLRLVQHAIIDRYSASSWRYVQLLILATPDYKTDTEYLIVATDNLESGDTKHNPDWFFQVLDKYQVDLIY